MEPNDHPSEANPVEIGETTGGSLKEGRDDVDYFVFDSVH